MTIRNEITNLIKDGTWNAINNVNKEEIHPETWDTTIDVTIDVTINVVDNAVYFITQNIINSALNFEMDKL